jgi:hypothetical protein
MLATVGRRSKTSGAYDAMRQAVVSCLHQVLGGGVDLVELVIVSRDAGGGEPGSVVVGQGVEIDGGGDPVGDGDAAGDLAVGVRCGQGSRRTPARSRASSRLRRSRGLWS